jgi:hypothetical protein
MKHTLHNLGDREMGILDRIMYVVFGEDVYCDHGLKGSDGVCMDCCNDLYEPSDDEMGEVIDFHTVRDTI